MFSWSANISSGCRQHVGRVRLCKLCQGQAIFVGPVWENGFQARASRSQRKEKPFLDFNSHLGFLASPHSAYFCVYKSLAALQRLFQMQQTNTALVCSSPLCQAQVTAGCCYNLCRDVYVLLGKVGLAVGPFGWFLCPGISNCTCTAEAARFLAAGHNQIR